MPLTLSARDHLILLRTVPLPADLRELIVTSPQSEGHHELTLTDDDYLTLAQQLTLKLRTVRNAKTRGTLARILDHLTEQNEARQPEPPSSFVAAASDPEFVRAVIDKLAHTVPGWADFSMTDMVREVAEHLPVSGEENIRRVINIIGWHHDTIPRPMFHGLNTVQISALLHNDWTADSPGLILRPGNLTPELVLNTRAIRRAAAFLDALGEKGTPATKLGNLNRKFVASLMDEFAIPAQDLADLRYFDTVLNEADVFPVHEMHLWMKLAKLVRRYRGRVVALKQTREIVARGDWPTLYASLFETAFQAYNLNYRSRVDYGEGLQHSLAFCFHQLAKLDTEWHDLSETIDLLLLPEVSRELMALQWGDVRSRVIIGQLLEPLEIFGLVEFNALETAPDKRVYPTWTEFRKTPLFERFVDFELAGDRL